MQLNTFSAKSTSNSIDDRLKKNTDTDASYIQIFWLIHNNKQWLVTNEQNEQQNETQY